MAALLSWLSDSRASNGVEGSSGEWEEYRHGMHSETVYRNASVRGDPSFAVLDRLLMPAYEQYQFRTGRYGIVTWRAQHDCFGADNQRTACAGGSAEASHERERSPGDYIPRVPEIAGGTGVGQGRQVLLGQEVAGYAGPGSRRSTWGRSAQLSEPSLRRMLPFSLFPSRYWAHAAARGWLREVCMVTVFCAGIWVQGVRARLLVRGMPSWRRKRWIDAVSREPYCAPICSILPQRSWRLST